MTAAPWSVDLGPGPPAADVLVALATREPSVGALVGRWFGGGPDEALLLGEPVERVRGARADDLFDLLDGSDPREDRVPEGDGTPLVGGGWLVVLGPSPDTSWAADHDWVLRRSGGTWRFETLGRPGREEPVAAALEAARAAVDAPPTKVPAAWPVTFEAAVSDAPTRHLAAVEAAIGRIDRGTFYQVNLCTRLETPGSPDPVGLFARLLHELRPAYAGLVVDGDRALVSCSPELFLAEHDGRVVTAPIKGTTASASDPTGARLAGSAKDVAENVMITDLMRHDLSRVCRPGTVTVERLLELQRHPGVWHLVSTVAGRLAAGRSRADLLRATYPPGSVTGAPKSSALVGIADLEPVPRGAYTGAFGLAGPAGMELAVTIRSFEVGAAGTALGVGGGITADSVPVREWYECLHKARPLLAAIGAELAPELRSDEPEVPAHLTGGGLIETILVRAGVPVRAAAHLARLDRSARELYGDGVPADLAGRVRRLAAACVGDRWALRVHLDPAATVPRVDLRPLGPRIERCALVHAERPTWSWRHKWADRRAYAAAEAATAPALPWFLAPDGTVAETSRGTLFVLRDDAWRTPPAGEHLLPGVTRRETLDVLAELGVPTAIGRLTAGDLHTADAAFWTSSLSGAVAVDAVDGHVLGSAADLLPELNRRLGV